MLFPKATKQYGFLFIYLTYAMRCIRSLRQWEHHIVRYAISLRDNNALDDVSYVHLITSFSE